MMQNSKAGRVPAQPLSTKFLFVVILVIIFLGFGLYVTNVFKVFQLSRSREVMTISQGLLETKYGLRVNLIAVTAAGGMVDVRLKVVDAEKAKALFQDKKNFPTLVVTGSNTRLNASEDTKSQEVKLEDGGNLFLLFPNAGSVVRPGSSVILEFGEAALEPFPVK